LGCPGQRLLLRPCRRAPRPRSGLRPRPPDESRSERSPTHPRTTAKRVSTPSTGGLRWCWSPSSRC
jgi:hypothetical protein